MLTKDHGVNMRCNMCMKDGPVRQIGLKVYEENDLAICESCEKQLIAVVTAMGTLMANAYRQAHDEMRKQLERKSMWKRVK